MNFGVIFLCLLVGATIGFEFGKYTERQRIREAMKGLSDSMKDVTGKLQELAEKQKSTGDSTVQDYDDVCRFVRRFGIDHFDTRCYRMKDDVWATSRKIDRKKEMNLCSRLITDMTLNGAMDADIARVIRYSMVVIDADKLRLDWEKARADEGVELLVSKYIREEPTLRSGDADGDECVTHMYDPATGIVSRIREEDMGDIRSQAEEAIRDGERA